MYVHACVLMCTNFAPYSYTCIQTCTHARLYARVHMICWILGKLEDGHAVLCVCMCLYMNVCTYICGVYLACAYSVGAVRHAVQWYEVGWSSRGWNSMGLSSLVLLGCTALPETSIWMVAVCPNGRENGKRGKMGCM